MFKKKRQISLDCDAQNMNDQKPKRFMGTFAKKNYLYFHGETESKNVTKLNTKQVQKLNRKFNDL